MPQKHNRRDFLRTSAAAGVGYWVASGVSPAHSQSPNERIQFASIGVGGKGASDSADAERHGAMVAICDVDQRMLSKAKTRFKDAREFVDFRQMLDQMGDKIDAVTVSTPDHNHAAASVMAMKMGKHCFCQKPLTHSLYEARVMAQVASETKVATQMGNQGTAEEGLRKAAAVIQAGALGTVNEVHVWTNRPIWPQGIQRPTDTPPVPSYLAWDEWLGPAPERPYHAAYHPFKWRGWWDFGTGALGDMACHTLNMPYMALDLRDPISVEAQSSGHNNETYPGWSVITYEFAARGSRPALVMTWYDGGKLPSNDLLDGRRPSSSGALVIGERGKLYSPGDYADKYELLGGVEEPKVEYTKSPGHFEEWVRAIKGEGPAVSNFADYAGPLTETVLLGNLAVWSGRKVYWDAENLKATGAPDLDAIIHREYREGYSL
jgi:predicted dehydrogenase